jgi:hypothetical protein
VGAVNDFALNPEWITKKLARGSNLAIAYRRANCAATHDLVHVTQPWHRDNVETQQLSGLSNAIDIANSILAEGECFANPKFLHPCRGSQPLEKCFGGKLSESEIELHRDNIIETCQLQSLEFVTGGADATGKVIGPEHHRRKRLERHNRGSKIERLGPVDRLFEQQLMSTVDTVKRPN